MFPILYATFVSAPPIDVDMTAPPPSYESLKY